jgi:hypothetical protein
MGWQTTFNLAKRSKGCYLVTDEILGHIQQGLNGVQVSTLCISGEGQYVNDQTRQVGMLFLTM